MTTKDALRSLTPPAVWRAAHRIRRFGEPKETKRPEFEGPYPSWEAAASQATGWDSPAITERTLAAALKVRDGQALVERDGIVREHIEYSETILAFLLIAAKHSEYGVDIIDFGGGLASNYYQHRRILARLGKNRWSIIERPIFVKLGCEHFQSSEVTFCSSLADILWTDPKAILFSGSLQCLVDPFRILAQVVASSGIDLVAIDRVLMSPSEYHAAFVQNPSIYAANYPVWCFSRDRMVEWFWENGFDLVEHFTSNPDAYFDHCGMIFARRMA